MDAVACWHMSCMSISSRVKYCVTSLYEIECKFPLPQTHFQRVPCAIVIRRV